MPSLAHPPPNESPLSALHITPTPPPPPQPCQTPKPPPKPPTPTNITIEPITATTLPAYRRLITLLLPIRYPDKFYTEALAHPAASSLALCALYHDPHLPTPSPPKLIAAIQCRLDPPAPPSLSPSPNRAPTPPPALYISTLCTLAPHRRGGLATLLLNTIIHTLLVHYGHVTSVYAHVWEANEEALEWYRRRGFVVGERVEGYYRRLKPQGARVVRRRVGGVGDWLGGTGRGGMEWGDAYSGDGVEGKRGEGG